MTDEPPTAEAGSRPAPWVLDGLLGAGVTLVVSLFIAADVDDAQPDGWAYLWAVALGALMLARRRYPMIVVLLSAGAVVVYYASGYPAIGVAVPLAAAVFSAAEYGRLAASIVASTGVLLLSTGYRLAIGQDPTVVVGYELPGHALLLAGAIAFGDSVRSRRARREQSFRIALLTAERTLRDAEQRATSERLAISRELHDTVGHALTVVALHAQIAEEALDTEPHDAADGAVARTALAVITDTTSATFDDVRRTVAALRREDRGAQPPLRIGDLADATRPAVQAGVDVRTHVDLCAPLPTSIETAVVRIVQESITNVVRHGRAAHVDVDIRATDDAVEVSIVNDRVPGTAPAEPARRRDGGGSGLNVMRERAELLGGTFVAGPRTTGFAVRATFPSAVPT